MKPGDAEYESLKRSIEVFGYVDPIIINADGTVIGGHQRLNILTDLGYSEADVAVVDLNKSDEKALNIALNKIAGEWDEEKLAVIFSELDVEGYDLSLTGFGEDEYAGIVSALAEATREPELNDPDAEVVPPRFQTTKSGDVWKIGKHRLMCGDSTCKDTINELLDGAKADMVMTDPPYGINAEKMTMGSGAKDFHRGEDWDRERPDISIAFDIAPLVCRLFADHYRLALLVEEKRWAFIQ